MEGVEIDKRLEYGKPAEIIIKLANKENYDLIILGSRGLSSVKRYLLGSVSEDVTWHAKRSVLIIR
jgi:nucleotide-binding universal stress UspA family protein